MALVSNEKRSRYTRSKAKGLAAMRVLCFVITVSGQLYCPIAESLAAWMMVAASAGRR